MKEIGDKIRHCSKDVCRLKNLDHQMVDKVLEGSFAAIVVCTILYYACPYLYSTFQQRLLVFIQPTSFVTSWIPKTIINQECRLAIAQEKMAEVNYYMGVQKNSPFINQLNKEFVYKMYDI